MSHTCMCDERQTTAKLGRTIKGSVEGKQRSLEYGSEITQDMSCFGEHTTN